MNSLFEGVLVSLSLIAVIGSQNAFILRTAIKSRWQEILAVCGICILCDVFLMWFGIFNLSCIEKILWLKLLLLISGAVFLFIYGFFCLRSTWYGNIALTIEPNKISLGAKQSNLGASILGALAVTTLNPHVYLDTIFIIGSIGSSLSNIEKYSFFAGGIIGSAFWFISLGYFAKKFNHYLGSRKVWRVINFTIAIFMWYMAGNLVGEIYPLTKTEFLS